MEPSTFIRKRVANIPFIKFFESFKVHILQNPSWKISTVESVFNKITGTNSRPGILLKRTLRQECFLVDQSEYLELLQKALT